MFPDPVVYSFIMAAEEDEILLQGELIGYSLVQTLAAGDDLKFEVWSELTYLG